MVKLDEIVRDVCLQAGDTEYKLYDRMLSFVVRGVADMNVLIGTNVRSEYLDIDRKNYTVQLPDSCDFPTKVGIAHCGTIVLLYVDDSIPMPKDDACICNTSAEACSTIQGILYEGRVGNYPMYPFTNVYQDGLNLGVMYGAAGGFNRFGYYRIDKPNHRIVLDPIIGYEEGTQIIIEWSDSGLRSSISKVPDNYREALISFALWKYLSMQSPGAAMAHQSEYMRQKNVIRIYETQLDLQQYRNILARNTKSVVKR